MKNLIIKDELSSNKLKSVLMGFKKGSFFSSRITEEQIIDVWFRFIQDIISNEGLLINFLVEDINSIHSRYAIKDLESLLSNVNLNYQEDCIYGFFQDLGNLKTLLGSTYDLNLTLVVGNFESDFVILREYAILKNFELEELSQIPKNCVLNFLFPSGRDVVLTFNRNIGELMDKTIRSWTS